MTDQLFYEGPHDALRAVVQALGGAKAVGCKIWPDKTPDAAGRHMLDCLNHDRAEKLDITQVMLIFRLGREAGIFQPFVWFAGEVGFDARPITKDEEADRLASVIEQSSKTLAAATAALERIHNFRVVNGGRA